MRLTHACIVTEDVARLTAFYREVLQIQPQTFGEDYVEFATEGGILSVYSRAAQDRLAPGSARAAANQSVMLEFRVDDVDREYARLQMLAVE